MAERKQLMKAAVIRAPGDFCIEEVPKPVCPEKGMLLKILACGLCGSDLRTLRQGHHRVNLPFILGHEIAGQVVETSPGYSGKWKVGEKLAVAPLVFCGTCEFCKNGELELCTGYKEIGQKWQGGFAEYYTIPEEAVVRGTIQSIPGSLDPVFATLTEPLSSVINAQEKGILGLGDNVVIIGAGPIGALHLELAKAKGANQVIIADISEHRLKLINDFGPGHVINSAQEDVVKKVREITNGMGADVVITANPAPQTHVQAVQMAKKGGRILLFGGLPRDKETPMINMNTVHYNALKLFGTTIFSRKHNARALQLIASGKINANKIISHKFPLTEFEKGAKLALEGKAQKVVFIP